MADLGESLHSGPSSAKRPLTFAQEWHRQLRSSLHPALFSLAYLLADKLSSWLPGALRTAIIMAAPRTLQALIAALGDWHTWQLAVKIYGPDADSSLFVVSLPLQLLSWQLEIEAEV